MSALEIAGRGDRGLARSGLRANPCHNILDRQLSEAQGMMSALEIAGKGDRGLAR